MIHLLLASHLFAASLTAQKPIQLPGGVGSFDFMNIDAKDHLAFACQPGKKALIVIHMDTDTATSVDLGKACNGMSVDRKGKKVYAAGPDQTLVQVDMTSWTVTGTLPLSGPGDSVIYDSKTKTVYVDNDDGTSLWLVDPATLKLTGTVTIKEAPEVMVLDSQRGKIFQNIKTSNTIQVIDIAGKQVVGEYTLGDLTSPHGLAEDRKSGHLFAVGKNGKLVILEADGGKVLSTVDVLKSSDQIAYDPDLKRIYIPAGNQIQTVQVTDSGATVLDTVSLPGKCHSVTVDPTTHQVWVAFSDAQNSYVMKLVPSAS